MAVEAGINLPVRQRPVDNRLLDAEVDTGAGRRWQRVLSSYLSGCFCEDVLRSDHVQYHLPRII